MDGDNYVIEMLHIRKEFPGIVANDDITLQVKDGEIHAILGENGAGKSTLMSILFGLYHADGGTIKVHGKEEAIKNPNDATRLGISMVHQHFQLVRNFTVTENIILGNEGAFVLRRREASKKIKTLSEKYGLNIDPDMKIEDISVGMQQRVEILKMLYRDAQILIFDEPTAVLTPQEIDELMEIIRSLTAAGKSILLITHKLKEIKASSDHCMIIRRGKYIDTVKVSEHTEDELASLMVGRKVSLRAETVLSVKELRARDYRGAEILKGLSLSIRGGEILGLAGIDGNGQSQLVEILTGLSKAESGEVRMGEENILNHTPRDTFLKGGSSIPEDRQKHGLVLDFTVAENLILQNFGQRPYSHRGILNKGAIRRHAAELIERFDIRPSGCEERPAGQLSGGNQQKVIIAREVTNDKELLIAFNPTRGLDVGAIEFVHSYLLGQRNKGRAILLVSFELEEIMGLSDRIAVIFDGRIAGEMPGKDADEYQLGLLMAGGKKDE